jgi:hypothetical protein
VRLRGLKGLENCSRLEDKSTCQRGGRYEGKCGKIIREGLGYYVRLRTSRKCSRRRSITQKDPRGIRPERTEPRPMHFRYDIPVSPSIDFPTIPSETELEHWFLDLYYDFLIEPTPYLVSGLLLYLGFILLFFNYYFIIWRLLCFFFQFLPWDEGDDWDFMR